MRGTTDEVKVLAMQAQQALAIRAGEVGAEVHGLDRGLHFLAWPIRATAPLVQARPASPFMLMSHIRGLLAGRSETEAEAQAAVAVGGGVPVPQRATGEARAFGNIVPAAVPRAPHWRRPPGAPLHC